MRDGTRRARRRRSIDVECKEVQRAAGSARRDAARAAEISAGASLEIALL